MTGARIKRLRRNLQEARLRLILADCPGADRLYSMKFAATKQVFHMSSTSGWGTSNARRCSGGSGSIWPAMWW